jgi:hypothetical protein
VFRDRFKPHRFHRYFASIDREIAPSVRSGFYASDDLRYSTEVDAILIRGTIECAGGIRVEVEERLRILRGSSWLPFGGAMVELVFYRYNAVLLNHGTIFRYNSPHSDHRHYHHVHRFEVLGSGAEAVTELREQDVPSLRQVLKEAEDWHWAHVGHSRGEDRRGE